MDDIPKVMKGIQLTGHGGLDKLVFRDDIPVPNHGPRDVLIKVSAAGVNNTDLNTRLGWYSKSNGGSSDASWSGNSIQFPRIQGADSCGEVVAVGEQVDASVLYKKVLVEPCILEAGGKVLDQPWYFGSECDGGFAEYTVVAARHAHKINSKLSGVELASFPCSYSTAENLLTRSNVSLFGCTVLDEAVFRNLIKLIEAGKVSPLVANTFSLPQVPEAQKQFETKKHIGKLIIDISREG